MSFVQYLATEDIRFRADARPRSDEAIEALAESIAEVGLINPIRVRQIDGGYEVIAGSHRLTAVILNGEREILCILVDDDDLRAELAMIDENLCRAELSPSDRARQTARRKAIYEELHPETKAQVAGAAGSNRVQGNATAKLATASFADATAAATGQSERAVRRDAERGAKVADDALEMVRGTKLDTGSYLDKLKRVPREEQAAQVERDIAAPALPKLSKLAANEAAAVDPVAVLMTALDGLDGVSPSAVLSSLQPRDRARLCQRVSSAIDLLFEIQEGAQQ